ncbi:GH16 domain-containing protein [Mycena kentingensis (nom. inval.)]|nr:GH16 domain-containing protein [Mycena kentingensis (nom. inval.)]
MASPSHAYFPGSGASSSLLPSSPKTPRTPTSPFRSPAASEIHSLRPSSMQSSVSEKFNLLPDPVDWGAELSRPEPDDALHDPRRGLKSSGGLSSRGFWNVGCIAVLAALLMALFLGYPVTYHFTHNDSATTQSALVNATGQVPSIGNWGLIDLDTPKEFHKIYSYNDPSQELQLVFSDEFEKEGRTFYPGQAREFAFAAALAYTQLQATIRIGKRWICTTGAQAISNGASYSPSSESSSYWTSRYDPQAITTRAGALEINLTQVDDITQNHNMDYRSGMMTSWNKFCFTGGLILTSVTLPGTTNVFGWWPAVWTLGNLGRAGYGATLEGMWPYSYDACDVGTLPNQTSNGLPAAALTSGSDDVDGTLSYLPGQRLSRCVCAGQSHPGPVHEDGTYVGRSAPEIDVFEAQIGGPNSAHVGQVSQSAQWAPFNAGYNWVNTTDTMYIADLELSMQNTYSGGIYQQATSLKFVADQDCYQLKGGCYQTFGFEYVPGYDDAYITWISDNKVSWTVRGTAVGADPLSEISARPITEEPLYMLINLGISHSFSWIDTDKLVFPATMRVDWIRVYQHPDKINIGCDPPARPTAQYINTYIEAYTNPNLTTWSEQYGQPVPKNKLTDTC